MAPSEAFCPSRLLWARRRRGLSQAELASAIGTEVRSIKGYEAGQFAPKAERLRSISRKLEFPTRFFLGANIGDIAPNLASFRSPSTMIARSRDMALGSAGVATAIDQWIAARYALPEVNLPEVGSKPNGTEAAGVARRHWDLGNAPIGNIVHLFEANGIRIYSLPDALVTGVFSLWHANRPYLLLDPRKSADQVRFDVARELGHLLLHREKSAGRKGQQEASTFARAFLVPAPGLRGNPDRGLRVDLLAAESKHWGVSPPALAQRLYELGRLTDWEYRNLDIGTADADSEHGDGPAHGLVPEILQAVFAMLRARGITRHTLARELSMYLKDIDELTFRQASVLLDDVAVCDRKLPRLRPRLAVVS